MVREHPLEHAVPPPLLAVGAALAQRALPRRAPSRWRRVLAGGFVLGATAFAGGADVRFRRSGTTHNPLAPERASHLVTEGPFTLTRNPMYVGMAALLLAHAAARGHVVQLVPVAGWVAYIDRFQVRPEERALEQVFGAEYDDYRRQVRRWL